MTTTRTRKKVSARGSTKAVAKAATKRRVRRAKPSGRGQPTLLTPENQAEIVRLLARGNYLETVARVVGIGRSTIYDWQARGLKELTRLDALRSEGVFEDPQPSEARYVDFFLAVDRADAQAEVYAAGTLVDLMDKKHDANVRRLAAVNFLDRRHRARWARTERHEVDIRSHQRIELSIDEQVERSTTILTGLVEVRAVDALAAQKAIQEGGHVDEDDD